MKKLLLCCITALAMSSCTKEVVRIEKIGPDPKGQPYMAYAPDAGSDTIENAMLMSGFSLSSLDRHFRSTATNSVTDYQILVNWTILTKDGSVQHLTQMGYTDLTTFSTIVLTGAKNVRIVKQLSTKIQDYTDGTTVTTILFNGSYMWITGIKN